MLYVVTVHFADVILGALVDRLPIGMNSIEKFQHLFELENNLSFA